MTRLVSRCAFMNADSVMVPVDDLDQLISCQSPSSLRTLNFKGGALCWCDGNAF